ncbi:Fe-S cluster assembly protein SufB, partial [Rhizobium sp. KAs_5_22]
MATEEMEKLVEQREYKQGFFTEIESETLAPGLDEEKIKFISEKKGEPEWMLEWRLDAYHQWLTMKE